MLLSPKAAPDVMLFITKQEKEPSSTEVSSLLLTISASSSSWVAGRTWERDGLMKGHHKPVSAANASLQHHCSIKHIKETKSHSKSLSQHQHNSLKTANTNGISLQVRGEKASMMIDARFIRYDSKASKLMMWKIPWIECKYTVYSKVLQVGSSGMWFFLQANTTMYSNGCTWEWIRCLKWHCILHSWLYNQSFGVLN